MRIILEDPANKIVLDVTDPTPEQKEAAIDSAVISYKLKLYAYTPSGSPHTILFREIGEPTPFPTAL